MNSKHKIKKIKNNKLIKNNKNKNKSDTSILEEGGPKGPEPTRYGDWEKNGRCTDF